MLLNDLACTLPYISNMNTLFNSVIYNVTTRCPTASYMNSVYMTAVLLIVLHALSQVEAAFVFSLATSVGYFIVVARLCPSPASVDSHCSTDRVSSGPRHPTMETAGSPLHTAIVYGIIGCIAAM